MLKSVSFVNEVQCFREHFCGFVVCDRKFDCYKQMLIQERTLSIVIILYQYSSRLCLLKYDHSNTPNILISFEYGYISEYICIISLPLRTLKRTMI